LSKTGVNVKIVLASSIDGKIADANGVWRPLCPHDEERFYQAMRWADAIIVGWRTLIHSGLDFSVKGKKITKALVDPRGEINTNHKFFDSNVNNIVVFGYSRLYPQGKMLELRKKNVDVIMSDKYPIEPEFMLSVLANDYGARNVLVAGGGTTAWYFLEKLTDVELQITVAPVVLGDSPYHNIRAPSLSHPGLRLKLTSARLCECGQEVVCTYRKHF
jgi:riboflavin biosynthesis pyrimidine reductase